MKRVLFVWCCFLYNYICLCLCLVTILGVHNVYRYLNSNMWFVIFVQWYFPNTWWMYGKSSATTFGTSAGAAHADSGLVLFSAPWCTKWSNRPMKRSRCFCTWFGEVSPCGWRCLLKPAFLFASPKCQVWNLTTRPVRLHWRRLWRQWRLETFETSLQ